MNHYHHHQQQEYQPSMVTTSVTPSHSHSPPSTSASSSTKSDDDQFQQHYSQSAAAIREAVSQNNQAAMLMDFGNYQEASQILSSALNTLRTAFPSFRSSCSSSASSSMMQQQQQRMNCGIPTSTVPSCVCSFSEGPSFSTFTSSAASSPLQEDAQDDDDDDDRVMNMDDDDEFSDFGEYYHEQDREQDDGDFDDEDDDDLMDGTNNSEYFIHRRPIQVQSSNPNQEIAPTAQSIELLSYSVVYNLALCQHLRAMLLIQLQNYQQQPLQSQHEYQIQLFLHQALQLYRNSQYLLCHHTSRIQQYTGNSNSSAVDVMHSLAVLNNVGHVHTMLHNTNSAKECFQHLLKGIMCVLESRRRYQQFYSTTTTTSGPSGRRSSTSSKQLPSLNGFLSNVYALAIGSTLTAPAA